MPSTLKSFATFFSLMIGVGMVAVCAPPPTSAIAGDQPVAGSLLDQVEHVASDIQGAKSGIEEAKTRLSRATLAMGGEGAQPSGQVAPAAAPKPPQAARQANMATAFQWECPKEFEEHTQHVITIVTDAKYLLPVVRDGLDQVPVFGPVVTPMDPDNPELRSMEYAWTAAPNSSGYGVEVITFDPERGIKLHSQKVMVIPATPPTPDPPTGGGGFGLAAQVPGWLATVPASAKSNQVAIRETMLNLAGSASKFESVSQMLASLNASLSITIQDKQAWSKFGASWNSAIESLIAAGKIVTPADYAQALREVGGAL